jgi:translocation and assembly module TamB
MSRRTRNVLLIAGGSTVGVIALAIVAAIVLSQTQWFRGYVKDKIIEATENATGGKVDVGSFDFDWRHLQAEVGNLVIHGSEPADAPPFLRVQRIVADVRLFTSIHRIAGIGYLGIAGPEANIMVLANGQSNVPKPKPSPGRGKPPLQTIVNLAVGHFDLSNGMATFAEAKQMLNLHADDFRAQLLYDAIQQGYRGQLAFRPLYAVSGRNTPVTATVTLPVSIERDRVALNGATITTPKSNLRIDASIENLRNPEISARVSGQIALEDVKNAGDIPLDLSARDVPKTLAVDADAKVSSDSIQVSRLRLNAGQSSIAASGTLKSPQGKGVLEFRAQLALGQIGRLGRVAQNPEGTLALSGTAKLDEANIYDFDGNLRADRISAQEGARRIGNVDLDAALHVDPHYVGLNKLRLSALGGVIEGNASLHDFARYEFHGDLESMTLKSVASIAGEQRFAYAGTITGPIDAAGNLKVPRSATAQVRLSIAPDGEGIPVSGRLFASYDEAADDVRVENSYVALPHSRLNLSGAALRQLDVSLTTTDLSDFPAAVPSSGTSPVGLEGHPAEFTGTLTGGLTSPRIAGHLRTGGFAVEGRMFDRLALDASVSRDGAAIQNGELTGGMMHAQLSARVGLDDWKLTPNQPVALSAEVLNSDLADVAAFAGRPATEASGAFQAMAQVGGTLGNPSGSARLMVSNGMIREQPFQQIQVQVNLEDGLIAIPSATVDSGSAHLSLAAEFHHPRDNLNAGQIHAYVQSNPIDLAQIRPLEQWRPNTAGTVQMNIDATGDLGKPEFALTRMTANISADNLRFEQQNYGDLTVNARTSGQTVQYLIASTFADSNIHINGTTQLQRDYATSLDATIANLPIERVLAVAQRTDVPARGTLSGTAHFSGSKDQPAGNLALELTNAVLYDEPVSRLTARASYEPQMAAIQQLDAVTSGGQIGLTAEFDHPRDNLETGTVQFHLSGKAINLARVRNVQARRPGLGGTLRIDANGSAELLNALPRVSVRALTANIAATGITTNGKNFGDATLTADTRNNTISVALNSDLAGAAIKGQGTAQLAANYPVDAQLSFEGITWTRLQGLVLPQASPQENFEATTDGRITVQGPATQPEQLRGSLRLTRLEVTSAGLTNAAPIQPIAASPRAAQLSIQNQGPIAMTLDAGTVRIDSAHLTGPDTEIQASGSFSLRDRGMNLTLNASANLAVLQQIDRGFSSSGTVTAATTVRGTLDKPAVNGSIQVQNVSVNYSAFPNGISNANGTIQFNGNSANLRDLTAEAGGGKLTLSGYLNRTDTTRFGLRANASGVRLDVQQGVSVVANANIDLTGTKAASTLSGQATIVKVNYAPKTDLGAILTRAAPPVQGISAPSPILDNMKLVVDVQTSDALAVQSSLAQSVEGNAALRVRGTASHPTVLGRVNLTEGTLAFFGTTYKVDPSSITFYNPIQIEPILDVNLETNTKGVAVTLHVTGPVHDMKLSYTSDPPLQFEEIVNLLASGRTPTSDPTLLANYPPQQQGITQMGESALLGEALANPVANRLQRVFGVTQLKIDPTFTAGSEVPQAELTLQQQITNNITFTYITQVNNANAETIRVQVTFTPRWSASALRDENGIFSINVIYKRQVR